MTRHVAFELDCTSFGINKIMSFLDVLALSSLTAVVGYFAIHFIALLHR